MKPADIAALAALARIAVRDDERAALAGELERILDFMRQIADEGSSVASETEPAGRLRADVVTGGLALEDVRRTAPDFGPEGFRVPAVIPTEMPSA